MNIILTSLGVSVRVGLCAGPLATQSNKMNVHLNAVYDHKPLTGCYGDQLVKILNIYRLASMGIRFTNDCTSPLCGPLRATIPAGRHLFSTGATNQE